MKTSNIGVLVSEERDMWTEATFDEIMVAFFFQNWPQTINLTFKKLELLNKKKNILKHIVVKMLNTKTKKMLKAKGYFTFKEVRIILTADLSIEMMESNGP